MSNNIFNRPLASLPIASSSLMLLHRAGFENIEDLGSLSASELSEGAPKSAPTLRKKAYILPELNLPTFLCEEIISMTRVDFQTIVTQPVTALLDIGRSVYSSCDPIDTLLHSGGLRKGCILELGGPPGCPKERAALSILKNTVKKGEGVVFVDTQNMIPPSIIKSTLKDLPGSDNLVHYVKCHTLSELFLFFYNLSHILETNEKTSVLILNTLSFLFQNTGLSSSTRSAFLEQIKTLLTNVCAKRHLTVVITTQLSTKMLNNLGPLSSESTKRAIMVMVPQLGDIYLPTSKSYRMVFIPDSPSTGMVRLISSPGNPSSDKSFINQEPYKLVDGEILRPER